MKSIPRIAALAAALYVGSILWQLAMHGWLSHDPAWYLLGAPIAIVMGMVVHLVTRKRVRD